MLGLPLIEISDVKDFLSFLAGANTNAGIERTSVGLNYQLAHLLALDA